ncbi:MAG: CvpA family protein [Chloroflexota bacterium]|nr:CvpA family protein [Chloroflexota bacterium]
MNAVDVAIVCLVGTLAVLGLRRGFLLGTLDLVGVAAGLVLSAIYYRRLIDPLVDLGFGRGVAAVVAFAALNVVAQAVVALLSGALFRPLGRLRWPWPVRWGDGLLGMLPGAVKGLAIAAVVVLPLAFLQRPLVLSEEVRSSRLADPLVDLGLDALYGAVERFDVDLADFAVITSRPAEHGVTLPFAVTEGLSIDEEAEAEVLRLVNAERAAAGLDPVKIDRELAAVARAHSEEMFRLGYFAHRSPRTGEPGDRLDDAGVRYLASGENLAYAPSVAVAHRGLMESPGHRANILNPAFARLGVGVVRSPNRGLMISQEFAA